MDFGIYIHIPYCIQRCHYCDFATYERSRILPQEDYVFWLCEEIRQRQSGIPFRDLKTIYFGGGTPSLLSSQLIVAILDELGKHGFRLREDAEVTIEINPATIDKVKLAEYLKAGINRFSVGAQSFNERLLKSLGREHSVKDTFNTLDLLRTFDVNFTFDLLFALPTQTLDDLQMDLDQIDFFKPTHISTYCLTLGPEHPLNKNRPPEGDQIAMFTLISERLRQQGFQRYEISNFAMPGFLSKHNLLYWTDQAYWGLGLSAHSYLPQVKDWGARFWNHSSMKLYLEQIKKNEQRTFSSILESLDRSQIDLPERHQSLTDYCHTSLRLSRGLDISGIYSKYGTTITESVEARLDRLVDRGWIIKDSGFYQLSEEGIMLSNKVFEEMTFLRDELPGGIDIPG